MKLRCQCGKWLRMPDEAVGRRARCPACQNVFIVPAPEPVPEPEPEPLGFVQDDHEQVPEEHESAPEPAHSDEFDIADDTDLTTTQLAAVAIAPQKALASKALQYGFKPKRPAPVLELAAGSTGRPYRYLFLLFALIPLVWTTFKPPVHETLEQQYVRTIAAHPEYVQSVKDLPDDASIEDVLAALPSHKLEGALLPYDTWMHWGFAFASGAGFFGLVMILFPSGHTKVWHLLTVGVFTGTAGILLLLGFQWVAFHMPLFRGSGVITILLDIVWLIGQSYSMALGDHGLVVSALGFTAGVGFCEEACKALPLIFVARATGFRTWRSAMIWGLVSGFGFGVSEGITYSHDYYNGFEGGQIYLVRFISCVGLHGIWAAATGINIFRRQDYFRSNLQPLEWVLQVLITVIVPMCLHGMYDTLLKQQYDWGALIVAVASFGWLAWQIELAKRKLDGNVGEMQIAA